MNKCLFLYFTPRCFIITPWCVSNTEAFLRKNCRFLLFSPRYIINMEAFLRNKCLFLYFTPRCFIITPRCISNTEAFLRKNCRFLLFSPRCIINMEVFLRKNCCFLLFSLRCIITENAFSQNVWLIPGKSCRIFLFPPRCFMEEWATSDNFCPTSRIFWPCLHSVWVRILVCSLFLFLLCPVCISRNSWTHLFWKVRLRIVSASVLFPYSSQVAFVSEKIHVSHDMIIC